jgi:hypothetical protein
VIVRTLTLLAILVGLPAVGHADGIHPYAPLSTTLSVMIRDDHGGGTETTSAGATLELALGSGRFQYFVDGTTAYLQSVDSGSEVRGGLGVRWLARSFEINRVVAFEMDLEGLTGLTRLHHDLGDTRVYPDVGFGVGWAIRLVGPRMVFRVSARAMFEQTRRDEMATASSAPGFVVLFGFGY